MFCFCVSALSFSLLSPPLFKLTRGPRQFFGASFTSNAAFLFFFFYYAFPIAQNFFTHLSYDWNVNRKEIGVKGDCFAAMGTRRCGVSDASLLACQLVCYITNFRINFSPLLCSVLEKCAARPCLVLNALLHHLAFNATGLPDFDGRNFSSILPPSLLFSL